VPRGFGASAPLWRVTLRVPELDVALPLRFAPAPAGAPAGISICTVALHPGSYRILNSKFSHAFDLWLYYHLEVRSRIERTWLSGEPQGVEQLLR